MTETSRSAVDPPTPTGSYKQIAWATQIRADLIKRIADLTDQMRTVAEATGQVDDQFHAVMAAAHDELAAILAAHPDAKWWIERRPFSTDMMVRIHESRPHGTIYDLVPQIQQAMIRAHAEHATRG